MSDELTPGFQHRGTTIRPYEQECWKKAGGWGSRETLVWGRFFSNKVCPKYVLWRMEEKVGTKSEEVEIPSNLFAPLLPSL